MSVIGFSGLRRIETQGVESIQRVYTAHKINEKSLSDTRNRMQIGVRGGKINIFKH